LPEPHSPRPRRRVLTIVGVGAVITLGIATWWTMAVHIAIPLARYAPHFGEAEAAAPRTVIDIEGTPVTLEDGRVRTACYSFDMPEGFELREESRDCQAFLNIPDGDSLSSVRVLALHGDRTALTEAAMTSGYGDPELGSLEVNGHEWLAFTAKDNWELPTTRLIRYDLPADYTYDGKLLDGIHMTAYSSFDPVLLAIAESLAPVTEAVGTE
jgi:hypothetical protein